MNKIELLLDLKHWDKEHLKKSKQILKQKFSIDFDDSNLINLNNLDELGRTQFFYLKNSEKKSKTFLYESISNSICNLSYSIISNYAIDIYEYMNIPINILEKNFLQKYIEECVRENIILYNDLLNNNSSNLKCNESINFKLAKKKYIGKLDLDKYGADIRKKIEDEGNDNCDNMDNEVEKYIRDQVIIDIEKKLDVKKFRFEKGSPRKVDLFIDEDSEKTNNIISWNSNVYMHLIDNYKLCKFHSNNKYSLNHSINFIKKTKDINFTFFEISFLERIYNNFFIFELSKLVESERTIFNNKRECEELYDCFLPLIYFPKVDKEFINKLFIKYLKISKNERKNFKKNLNRVSLYINFYFMPLFYMVFYNFVNKYFNIEEFYEYCDFIERDEDSKVSKKYIEEYYRKIDRCITDFEILGGKSDTKKINQFKDINRYMDNNFSIKKFEKKEIIKSMKKNEAKIQKDIIKENGYKIFIEHTMDILDKG